MSTALLERAFAQAALLPEDKQNSIANVVLELAAATPPDAAQRPRDSGAFARARQRERANR